VEPRYNQRLRRGFALAGIILVVLNLRPAITSLSPIYDQIGRSIPLNSTALGILGMLPPLAFALFGFLTPSLISRLGLERSLLLAMALVCTGQVFRSFSNDIWLFGITSLVSLAGMGFGNVLLPPVIKSYFPDRIGLVTSIYTSLIAISAALPSLLAVPVTQIAGWRVSTGMWSVLALFALGPWLLLLRDSPGQAQTGQYQRYPAWRWPITWGITILFAVGVLNNYTLIAWLPKILTASAGVSHAEAGLMLSMYNLIGIPHGLLVPAILSRTRRPFVVIAVGGACLLVGYLGLNYFPLFAWGWILCAGVGLMLVPISLTLINLRSRTEDGAAALSSFTQGTGYLIGAVGPVVVGGLHSVTNQWTAAFWFLSITALVALGAGTLAARPGFIEKPGAK
jgi:CP family cyanate transporter-like MFS transporter